MTYKILRQIPKDLHYTLVLETVDEKPDMKTVMWFSVANNELIPQVTDQIRAEKIQRGAVNKEFREKQYNLFKKYYNLTDYDDIPYKHPYTKK